MLKLAIIVSICVSVISSSSINSEHNEVFKESEGGTNSCDLIRDGSRFDCYPQSGATEPSCEARGCCWRPSKGNNYNGLPHLNIPYCFYPPGYTNYVYENITKTQTGFVAFLKKTTNSYRPYRKDVNLLQMNVYFSSDYHVRVKIFDPLNARYEVPIPAINMQSDYNRTWRNDLYLFIFSEPANFKVIRKMDGTVLFDTSVGNLIFSDQFIQLSTILPSEHIYGLGEHQGKLRRNLNWNRFVFFSTDQAPYFGKSLYGSHPFYLAMENSGRSHGVFLLNSNALEVILQPKPALTYRTLGGIIDLHFMLGPTPQDVVTQYTSLIGQPMIPPYWSLGFHLCRFGYGSLKRTKEIWSRNREFGLPFDTQWNDLDYMDERKDFTYDKIKFNGLPAFIDELHKVGMKYITIVDPAISANRPGEYPPFDEGVKMDIFIKNATNGLLYGKVWPVGPSVYPDFTNPKTHLFWENQIKKFRSIIPVDGIWIDMNEPSNFVTGSIHGCPASEYEYPEYVPPMDYGTLAGKTLCMTAKQKISMHYNVHNLFGFTETIATHDALIESTRKRPFVISRSTFPGHGRYGGHWTGDVSSNWQQMKQSIATILNFNMFGIPMVGADICGFNGDTTASLCQRWMELGAFYPFSRNHNTDSAIDQDPLAFGPEVAKSSKKALQMRYSLLPYLYSLFYESHLFGKTVARPLFFEFPQDQNTYDIDTQFMWGSSVHIIPVLEEGSQTVDAYFPEGVWYDYDFSARLATSGGSYSLHTPFDKINVYFRGGCIVTMQKPGQTTQESRLNPLKLVVVYNEIGNASGDLYMDNGVGIDSVESNSYTKLKFESKLGWFYSYPELKGYDTNIKVGSIVFLNVAKTKPTEVRLNGKNVEFVFDGEKQLLEVKNVDVLIKDVIKVTWK